MGDTYATETGHITGTMDKDYNLIWFTQTCLENALRLETYRHDAERGGDTELAELFGKAQSDSRKGAEIGKQMLADRMTDMAHSAAGMPTMSAGSNLAAGGVGTTAQEDREQQAGDVMATGGTPPPRSVEQAPGDQRTDVMATDWAPEDDSSAGPAPTETGSGLA
jgi:hypothetical protein